MRTLTVILLLSLSVILGSTGKGAAQNPAFQEGLNAYNRADFQIAIEIWSPLASEGDAEAAEMLGLMYALGRGVKPDPRKAFQWYRQAALGGSKQSMHELGIRYLTGIGVEKNADQALKWLRDAGSSETENFNPYGSFQKSLRWRAEQSLSRDDVAGAIVALKSLSDYGNDNAIEEIVRELMRKDKFEAAKSVLREFDRTQFSDLSKEVSAAAVRHQDKIRDREEQGTPQAELRAAYLAYMTVKKCHETSELLINSKQRSLALSAVKEIEFALTRKDSKIDTDELWKRAARSFQRDIAPSLDLIGLVANISDQLPIEARSLCRLQLIALRTATGDRLKKDQTTQKDF